MNGETKKQKQSKKKEKHMAHDIREHDEQHGIEMAWHKLTKVQKEISFEDNWLAKWDVQPEKLFIMGADGKPIETEYSLLTASDVPGLQIGKPFNPATYTVLTNRALLEMLKKALAGTGHQIVSIGSLQNRNKIFVSISLENLKKFKIAGREFENFLNIGNGHTDGSPAWANTSGFCTVCANTFAMNLAHKGKTLDVRIKHSKNFSAEFENMPAIIDAAIGVQAEFQAALASLSKIPATLIQAERTFTGFLTDARDIERAKEKHGAKARRSDVISTRSENTAKRLTELFSRGAGNKGKDFVDIFSAATDFYTHESSGGSNRWKQFESSEFGAALRNKQEFFELIKTEKSRDELEQRGAKVLEMAN